MIGLFPYAGHPCGCLLYTSALGWPGAAAAIEGPKGWLAALAQSGPHAGNEDAGEQRLHHILTEDLGTAWAIERNIYKRYPFCLGAAEPLEGLSLIHI